MKKLVVVRSIKKKSKERIYTPADLMSDPLGDDDGIQSHWWYYENEVVFDVNKQWRQTEEWSFEPLSKSTTTDGWEEEGEP